MTQEEMMAEYKIAKAEQKESDRRLEKLEELLSVMPLNAKGQQELLKNTTKLATLNIEGHKCIAKMEAILKIKNN